MDDQRTFSRTSSVLFREYDHAKDRQTVVDTFDTDPNNTRLPKLALNLPHITADSDQWQFVLELDDHRIIAFLNAHLVSSRHECATVYAVNYIRTATGFRNQGFGTKLLRDTKKFLEKEEWKVTLTCTTALSNDPMMAVLSKLGNTSVRHTWFTVRKPKTAPTAAVDPGISERRQEILMDCFPGEDWDILTAEDKDEVLAEFRRGVERCGGGNRLAPMGVSFESEWSLRRAVDTGKWDEYGYVMCRLRTSVDVERPLVVLLNRWPGRWKVEGVMFSNEAEDIRKCFSVLDESVQAMLVLWVETELGEDKVKGTFPKDTFHSITGAVEVKD